MFNGQSEIEFQNVTKVFNEGTPEEIWAVNNMSLIIKSGQMLSLLGPSGCGKTTSLRMIAGFEYPTSGKLNMWGKRANDIPPQKRDVSMVFQSYGLFPHMTVGQNIEYGLRVKHLPSREIKKALHWALELTELEGLENRSTGELSGGQQQRVALCRAIVTQPKALLFDEPLSNLDAKLRRGTREHLRKLQQELNVTGVYVTHDQTEAMSISDHVVVMDKGQVQQIGGPREIYSNPANSFVADFIGEANFLPAKIESKSDDKFLVSLFDKTVEIGQSGEDFSIGEEVKVVVRPEAVDLVAEGEGDASARVEFSHYTGSLVLYSLALPKGKRVEVQVINPEERGLLADGTRVGLKFHRHSLRMLKSLAKVA